MDLNLSKFMGLQRSSCYLSTTRIHTNWYNLSFVTQSITYYTNYLTGSRVSPSFGKGPHPDYITNIQCIGDEIDILSCSIANSVCYYAYDAGVICECEYINININIILVLILFTASP